MRLALVSVAALLLVAGASAKSPFPPDAYFFALDGDHAVFPRSAEIGKSCDVVIRDFATGKDVIVKPDAATEKACNGDPGGLLEQPSDLGRFNLLNCPCLAIAGTRIAWTVSLADPVDESKNYDILETATLAHPLGTKVAETTYVLTGKKGDEYQEGERITGVVGDGSLLAYNTYRYEHGAPVDGALRLVGGRTLATGLQATFAQSADRGHVALVRFDGSAGVYPGNATIEPAAAGVRSADVAGNVFGTIGRGNKLRLFTLAGKLLKTIQLQVGADLLRIDGTKAVYSSRSELVHLLDLRTGADRVIARAGIKKSERFGIRSLEFERGRVVYAWGANGGWTTGIVRVG